MKKIFIFIIITYIFSANVHAFAPGNRQLNIVKAMGIMQDNTNLSLTRAEAAVALCRVFGLEFKNIKSNPSFSDVPETHYAYGAIHLLAYEGIIPGISENIFSPNTEINFEQFVKMLISALKYNSDDYLKIGKELNLFDDGDENQPFNRLLAAKLICNAMNVNPILSNMPFKTGNSVMKINNLVEANGIIETIASDYFILKLKSIKPYSENTFYNKIIYRSDVNFPLEDTIKIYTASPLSKSLKGKDCTAYIYNPFFNPQLKYLATDDVYISMEIDLQKSQRVKTAKLEFPKSFTAYEYISEFKGGYAIVVKNGKYGVLDKNHNLVISTEYDEIGFFSDGIFPIKKDGKTGYVDLKGKIIISGEWAFCAPFSNGAAPVIDLNKKYGLINRNGKYILKPEYDLIENSNDGLFIVNKNDKLGVVDNKGKTLIPLKYDMITSLGNKIFAVTEKDKTKYLKINGSFQNKWDKATIFSDGFSSVLKDGKWGVINENGTLLIEPQYDRPIEFQGGRAIVIKDGSMGIIDTKNNFILPAKWHELKFVDGFIVYKSRLSGLYGLMDTNGAIITEDIFKSISGVSEGRVFGILYDYKPGFLDTDMIFKYSYAFKVLKTDSNGFIISKDKYYGFMEW